MSENASLAALKPCPFCGRGPRIIARATAPGPGYFCAISCFCGGYSVRAHQSASAETIENARSATVAAWNTRAADQRCAELEAENARLREALEGMARMFGEPIRSEARAALENRDD